MMRTTLRSARVQTRLERDRRSPGLVRGHVRKEVARPVGLEAADLGLVRVRVRGRVRVRARVRCG